MRDVPILVLPEHAHQPLFGVKFESYLNQHENNPEKEKLKKIQTATEYLTEKEVERKSV